MSESKENINPKITAPKKEKDAKRVEAGKRLAAISKEAKERKMRGKIEVEKIEAEKDKSWDIDYGFLFGVVGVVSAIGTLYYARKDDIMLNNNKAPQPSQSSQPSQSCHSSLNESL